jgi:hypothetical protein
VLFGHVAGAYLTQPTSSTAQQVELVLQSLVMLHTQCPRFQRCVTELRSRFLPEDSLSMEMAADTADALKQIVHAYGQLRKHVIEFDRMLFGDRVKSFGELALRGQRFVIAMGMRSLRAEMENATDRDSHERALRSVLDDKFASFDDMAAFVAEALQRMTARWLPLREALSSPTPITTPSFPTDHERKALYLAAVRAAQQEMTAVNHGKFGDVLRAGIHSRRWPTFRRACLQMRVAMQTHPVPEIELSFLVAQAARSTRWRAEPVRAQG